jgi:hypothetical protein
MSSKFEIEFTKVLSANDIGSTKTHQAGFLIPKRSARMNYFPRLPFEIANPRERLEFFCPEVNYLINCNFIFYNGKQLGFSTRSEYRLTGLTSLIKEMNFKVGDQVAFGRIENRRALGKIENSNQDSSEISLLERLSNERIPFVSINGWKIRER